MLIYSKNFLYLKNTYLIPLISYQIPRTKLSHLTIKNSIASHPTSVVISGNNEYLVSIPKNIFFKSLLNEIQQFHIRSLQQHSDLLKTKGHLSKSWLMVTDYYKFFFTASCLARITYSGTMFLDNDISNTISSMFSFLAQAAVQIQSGTYLYKVKKINPLDVEVLIKKSGNKTHDSLWRNFSIDLIDMISNSSNDERTVLMQIQKAFNKFGANFPSKCRNLLNYRGEYAYHQINKSFFYNIHNEEDETIGKYILKNTLSDDLNTKLKMINLLSSYFFGLTNMLINDFRSRSGSSLYYINKYVSQVQTD